jgi:ribulose-5-phosphate 4-epimerase/fuculose-1-phosphate aldolase
VSHEPAPGSEGVIKFQMRYTPGPPLPAEALRELNAWRKILVMLEVVGATPTRYDGYGFGNISCRLEPWKAKPTCRRFAITGTQTGEIADLTPEHYVVVDECYPAQNLTVASGPVRPSSESMTHGAVYALNSRIRWVMHGHSPHIWHAAQRLAIPVTRADVPYGTPEMSGEVARLWRESDMRRRRIFSMGGHEDGIVTFGRTASEAGQVLLDALAASLY